MSRNTIRKSMFHLMPRNKAGFTLVITLTLMIILTTLAVGLLSIAAVSLRASSQGQALAIARQNARMALALAIGDLQKYAGQDQRITTTADIAGKADGQAIANGAKPANDKSINDVAKGLSAVQPGTRYWTAVFKNNDAPDTIYQTTPSAVLVQWLVSGSTSQGGTAPAVTPADPLCVVGGNGTVSDKETAVVLVGKHTVGSTAQSADAYVAVPLVEVADAKGDPVGRYGWWVGDEGVKAKLNISKTVTEPLNYVSLVAQRRGWETVTGMKEYPTPDSGAHKSIPKVITFGETALLVPSLWSPGSGASPLQDVFHAATADSRGLLTDVLNGGTKVDLSTILNDALPKTKAVPSLANYPTAGTNIITPPTTTPSSVRTALLAMKAPKWDAIKDFYDRGSTLDGGALLVKAANTDLVAAIAPVIVDFRILMGAKIATPSANNFTISSCGKIAVAIANPYSVPLKWKDDLEIQIVNSTPPGNRPSRIWNLGAPTAYIPGDSSESAVFNQAVFRIRSSSLAPGEARAYTLASSLKRPAGGATGRVVIDLAPVDPTTIRNFNFCVELENSDTRGNIPGMDVRESWQTTQATVEMRIGGTNQLLRRLDSFELDNGYFSPNTRSFSNEDATRITQPFPLMLYSFQISQPGVDYLSLMPAGYEMGQRSSTLRTYADFNLQATRIRKPIASYNPPPYFMESNNSVAQLPPANPPAPGEVGGDTGPGFSRNLAVSPVRWGRSASGSERTILYSVPKQVVSLAQLQHADLTGDELMASIGHQPAYAVGNSYATPFVKRSSVWQQRTDYQLMGSPNHSGAYQTPVKYYDLSYLLNAALWDAYFFSSLPRAGGKTPENPTIIHYKSTPTSAGLKDPVKAASLLMVDGSFNINSTDRNAWKAFLGSARHFKHAADSGNQAAAAFPRTLEQITSSAAAPTGNEADSFSGFRRLSDNELDALANEIVKQVRLRGPFVSLAQFVNRALADIGTQPAMSRSGTLQAAIDESGLTINFAGNKKAFTQVAPNIDRVSLSEKEGAPRADLDGGDRDGRPSDADPKTPDWAVTSTDNNFGAVAGIIADRTMLSSLKNEQGYRSTSIPGWLTQADVLQVIGPAISARSDTFRIRTFGETLNDKGISIARVYCEAIVQRVPEYVDPTNPATARGTALTTLNRTYGRRFQIVSFRWLSPNEI